MEDLTDIDEILKYLASVGISSRYNNGCILLNSEYIYDCLEVRHLNKDYKGLYNTQKFYQLLDNLFVNCQIGIKYDKIKYNIIIAYYDIHGLFQVYKCGGCVGDFKTIEDLMTYMRENHSECVRQVDIKIALK
jgi:hypothetical protein